MQSGRNIGQIPFGNLTSRTLLLSGAVAENAGLYGGEETTYPVAKMSLPDKTVHYSYEYSGTEPSLSPELQEIRNDSKGELLIYPNPGTGLFHVEIVNNSEFSGIKVLNNLGQMIAEQNVDATTAKIDISEQPSGMYFVKIATVDGILTRKIVKQ